MKRAQKHCATCAAHDSSITGRHEAALDLDGAPVWRCSNCGTDQPRRVRRTAEELLELEAREALGLAADDDSFDAMLALIEYGQRKAAGVPTTGELSLEDQLRLRDAIA